MADKGYCRCWEVDISLTPQAASHPLADGTDWLHRFPCTPKEMIHICEIIPSSLAIFSYFCSGAVV